MIQALYSYSSYTLNSVTDMISPLVRPIQALVNEIARPILQVVISIPLFYLHHNLFALGFVVGFVFDKQVSEVVEKVNVVYNAYRTWQERFLFIGGGGFLALLTMPTSMVIATSYYSAQWGASFYQKSLAGYTQRHSSSAQNL